MKRLSLSRLTPPKLKLISPWLLRLLLLFLAIVLLYQSWFLLHIVYWRTYPPTTSAFMQNHLTTLRQQNSDAKLQYVWINYSQISDYLKRAVIATEDARFLQHKGFDYQAIEIAWKKNLKQRKLAAGGSTISQQLAKNMFLSSKKTMWRKLQEALITIMLEKMMTKQRILEIYLNVIEWGNGVFGVEAAAHYYFGIPARSLAPEQSAWLASIISNPRFYDVHRQSPRLLKKASIILSRLPAANIP